MKKSFWAIAAIAAGLTGCGHHDETAPRAPSAAASMPKGAQSATAGGVCLFAADHSKNYYMFHQVHLVAAVADPVNGACAASAGAASRPAQKITLGWQYKGSARQKKDCDNATSCEYTERKYEIGLDIVCVVADAYYPDQPALHFSSNPAACP